MAGVPDHPLAIYPVRTPRSYWITLGVMLAFAVAGGAALIGVIFVGEPDILRFALAGAIGIGWLVPVAYWFATPQYRIGLGRGAIRFFADRLEVPDATGRMIAFARDALRASSRELRVRDRIAGRQAATVRRGHLLRFVAGARSRALSTVTIDRPRAFLIDLERYLAGEPPLGPDRALAEAARASARTSDEDRLDAELAQVE
jgi:hypothetical protein